MPKAQTSPEANTIGPTGAELVEELGAEQTEGLGAGLRARLGAGTGAESGVAKPQTSLEANTTGPKGAGQDAEARAPKAQTDPEGNAIGPQAGAPASISTWDRDRATGWNNALQHCRLKMCCNLMPIETSHRLRTACSIECGGERCVAHGGVFV
jgi:hypothetical protein